MSYVVLLAFGWATMAHAQQQPAASSTAAWPHAQSVAKQGKVAAKGKSASQHATHSADAGRARAVVGLSSGVRSPIDQYQNAVTPPPKSGGQ